MGRPRKMEPTTEDQQARQYLTEVLPNTPVDDTAGKYDPFPGIYKENMQVILDNGKSGLLVGYRKSDKVFFVEIFGDKGLDTVQTKEAFFKPYELPGVSTFKMAANEIKIIVKRRLTPDDPLVNEEQYITITRLAVLTSTAEAEYQVWKDGLDPENELGLRANASHRAMIRNENYHFYNRLSHDGGWVIDGEESLLTAARYRLNDKIAQTKDYMISRKNISLNSALNYIQTLG